MTEFIYKCINSSLLSKRGYSSVGRASALQAEGQRFESVYLHHFLIKTFPILSFNVINYSMLLRRKIGIIGAGDIGLNLAEILALYNYNIVVYNRQHFENGALSTHSLAKQGTIMDLNDSLQLPGCGLVKLTHDLNDLNNADVIVISAGVKRSSPTETREELAIKNVKIIAGFIDIAIDNPKARILIISNPVDFLTQIYIDLLSAKTNIAKEQVAKRVFGVSYIDTMRLRNITKEVLIDRIPDIDKAYVEGIAIGEHGPTMTPLISQVKVDGKNLTEIASLEEIQQIFSQTILRGNDIIKLTGMSSVSGPAHAAFFMINELLTAEKTSITASVWDGKRCIGREVIFYKGYLDHIKDTLTTDIEKTLLLKSEQALDEQYIHLKNLIEVRI